ncbi:MAG: Crp/Fnr family transcriptional regulator [Bacteroidales bacterium]|nr:Crp/Fnr family transcriptional regulator [Bacteroidales bacterium]MBN2820499.1 Crp/Fnr family transcriptional regulator [Bacteroidales bacterium]
MTRFANISRFFNTEFPLNKDGLQELYSLFKTKLYSKNQIILKGNTIEQQLRFLNKGIIREYYTTDEKDININFYTKPQFITDLLAFSNNSKTKKYQETLSEVELLVIDKQKFNELLRKYHCGKSIVNDSFQTILKQKEFLEYNRITKSPDELYKELLIYKPEWLQSIPQYHIASYLNITPETLSRIRKRIS